MRTRIKKSIWTDVEKDWDNGHSQGQKASPALDTG